MKNILILLLAVFVSISAKAVDWNQSNITINSFTLQEGNLAFTKNVNIVINDTLVIRGDVEFKNTANITIGIKGILIINGSIEGKNDVHIVNKGKAVITGNLKVKNNVSFSSGPCRGFIYSPTYKNNAIIGTYGSESDLINCDYNLYAYINKVLPVVLKSFQIKGNIIEWITYNEFNNDYIVLEESLDGLLFREIFRVYGTNTNSEYKYDHDVSLSNLIKYFRLKQVDFNGATWYSNIIVSSGAINSSIRFYDINGDESAQDQLPGQIVISREIVNGKLITKKFVK